MSKNNIPGWMTDTECNILRSIFSSRNKKDSVGIEIGSFHGRSSYEISKSIPLGTLYCMDIWNIYGNWTVVQDTDTYKYEGLRPVPGTQCSISTFLENTKECKNIIPIPIKDVNTLKFWTSDVDFLFLDAAHSNPSDKEYIDFWLPKIKPGGIISGHDYYANYPDEYHRRKYPDVTANIEFLETILNKKVKNPAGSIWYFDL